jgi:hypothetical protein
MPWVQDLSQDLVMTCDMWARAASLAALPRANAMWDDGVDGVLLCSLLLSSCVFASLSRFLCCIRTSTVWLMLMGPPAWDLYCEFHSIDSIVACIWRVLSSTGFRLARGATTQTISVSPSGTGWIIGLEIRALVSARRSPRGRRRRGCRATYRSPTAFLQPAPAFSKSWSRKKQGPLEQHPRR